MGGSIRLGRIAGIGIYIHWLFLAFIAGKFLWDWRYGTLGSAAGWAVLWIALFGCVLLHELGHALTAKLFGIRTRDITLLPIGGVARLERIPEKPTQELLITINGPLVNVVIAIVLFTALALTGTLMPLPGADNAATVLSSAGLLNQLLLLNIGLVFFNMLPAFPMDGGRILRALLAFFLDYTTATLIAARTGQGMAVLFAIGGYFLDPLLFVIAAFVFIGAQAEARAAQFRSAIARAPTAPRSAPTPASGPSSPVPSPVDPAAPPAAHPPRA